MSSDLNEFRNHATLVDRRLVAVTCMSFGVNSLQNPSEGREAIADVAT